MSNDPLSLLLRQLDKKMAEKREEEARLRRLNKAKNTSSSKYIDITRDIIRLQKAIEKVRCIPSQGPE